MLTEVVSIEGCVESGRDLTSTRIAIPILLLATARLLLLATAVSGVMVMLMMASRVDEWSEPRSKGRMNGS